MSVSKLITDKNKADDEFATESKTFKKLNAPILKEAKKKKQINNDINEQIKKAPDNIVKDGNSIITFDREEGVKVLLQKPYNIRNLPPELVVEVPYVRSAHFKTMCAAHKIYQFITPENMVAGAIERKIRVRSLSSVPYSELEAHRKHVENHDKCDLIFNYPDFPGFEDEKVNKQVDLNTATRAEIDAVPHMTTEMANGFMRYRKDFGNIEYLDDAMEMPYFVGKGRKKALDRIYPYVVQGFSDEVDPYNPDNFSPKESDEARKDKIKKAEKLKKQREEAIKKGEEFGDEEDYFEEAEKSRKINERNRERERDDIPTEKEILDVFGNFDMEALLEAPGFADVDFEGLLEQKERLDKLANVGYGVSDNEARLADDLTEEELANLRKEADEMLKGSLGEQFVDLLKGLANKILGKRKKVEPPKEVKEDVDFNTDDDYEAYEKDLDETIRILRDVEATRQKKLSLLSEVDTENSVPELIKNDKEELASAKLKDILARKEILRSLAAPREREAMKEMLKNANKIAKETFDMPDKEAAREDARLRKEEKEKRKKVKELQNNIANINKEIQDVYKEIETNTKIELERMAKLREIEASKEAKKVLEQLPSYGKDLNLDEARDKVNRLRARRKEFEKIKETAEKYLELPKDKQDPKKADLYKKDLVFLKKELPKTIADLRLHLALVDKLAAKEGLVRKLDDERIKELEELAKGLTSEASELEEEIESIKEKLKETKDKEEKKSIRKKLKEAEHELVEKNHLIDKYTEETITGEEKLKQELDLNTATSSQLLTFELHGDKINAMIDARESKPFKYLNDVLDVKGIGNAVIRKLLSSKVYSIKQGWDPDKKKPKEFMDPEELEEELKNDIKVPPLLKLTDKHRFLANKFKYQQLCRRVDLNSDPLSLIHILPNMGTNLAIKIYERRPYNDLIEILALIDDERITLKFLTDLSPLVLPEMKKKSLIDLNNASVRSLKTLPHINGTLAEMIRQMGHIEVVEELMQLPGINEREVHDINPLVIQKSNKRHENLINLNKDHAEKIELLPKVSTKKAAQIVKHRPYDFVEDLVDIPGFSMTTVSYLIGKTIPGSINSLGDFGAPIDINDSNFDELIGIPFVSRNTANILLKNKPVKFLNDLKGFIKLKDLARINPYVVQGFIGVDNPDELIDINKATVEILEELPGVGEKSAVKIYNSVPIKVLDDLITVLSFQKLQLIEPLVVQKFQPRESNLIDLNKDSIAKLSSLPSMNTKKAKLIFKNRPIKFLEEVAEIKGISERTVRLIAPHVIQDYEDEDSHLINLNKDNQLRLRDLPGVGEKASQTIVDIRPIRFLDELLEHFTKKFVDEINPLVVQKYKNETPEDEILLDLNKANLEQLKELPGLGETSANRIIALRKKKEIKYLEQILDIQGISKNTIDGFKDIVKQKYKYLDKDRLVDLNEDPESVLITVPHLGKVKAKAIIKNRPYEHLEDLLDIDGIKIQYLEKIEKYVTPKLKGVDDENRIDLNKATEKELLILEGIGKSTAKKIIQNRKYEKLEQLNTKAGISKKIILKIKNYVLPKLKDPDALVSLVNINTASKKTLLELPGIGEKNVEELIKNRKYEYLDELLEVKGFTEGIIKKFKDLVKPKLRSETDIDLNKDSKEIIVTLPEIDSIKADLIIKSRKITFLDDLLEVLNLPILKKIEPRTVQKLKTEDDEDRVNINSISLSKLKSLKPLKNKDLIAGIIFKNRPYQFLDDLYNLPGIRIKLVKDLSEYVLPEFRDKSKLNLTPEQEKTILDYVHKTSPKKLVEDIKLFDKDKEGNLKSLPKEVAIKINALKPYEDFSEFYSIPIVTRTVVFAIMKFLGMDNNNEEGDFSHLSKEEKQSILTFIHESSPLDMQKINIEKSLSINLNLLKPFKNFDVIPKRVKQFTPLVANLIRDHLEGPDSETEKVKIVLEFFNKSTYDKIIELPFKEYLLERIISKRPFNNLKEFLSVSGVNLDLVIEFYDAIVAPKLNKLVDLNKATLKDIDKIKGVTPKKAELIIEYRPIDNLNELEQMKGFGPASVKKIDEFVVQEYLPIIDLNNDTIDTIAKLPQISRTIAIEINKVRPIEYLDDLLEIEKVNRRFLNSIEDYVKQFFRPKNSKSRIDLNLAVLTELQSLPGVTRAKANLIYDNRPIKYLEDLLEDFDKKFLKKIDPKVVQDFEEDKEDEEDEPIIPIDLKTASAEKIKEIPGISEDLAEYIFDYKKYYPNYQLIDFFYIKHIGFAKTVKMSDYVTQKFPEKVDFNTLDKKQISELKPIKIREDKTQKDIAKLILDYKEENGPFEYLDDIQKVKYVTKSMIKLLAYYITLPAMEKEEEPDLNQIFDLNKGTADELSENIKMLKIKDAHFIVDKRPIKYLNDLLEGGPFNIKKLEKLEPFVIQKFDEDDENKPFEGKVNLNNDNTTQIFELPGMTMKMAENIVERRKQNYIFGLEDLLDKFNGRKSIFTMEKISIFRPYVIPTFSPASISDEVLSLLNNAYDWEIEELEPPLPNKTFEDLIETRQIYELTEHNILEIYGMNQKIINLIQKYLDKKNDDGVINLLTDNLEDMLELKGLTTEVAELIINYRPFKYLDDLYDLPTILRKDLEQWNDVVFPKLQFKYDINKSTEKQLSKVMTEKQAAHLVFNRPYTYLDDIIDENKVLTKELVVKLSLTPGVSLERDPDKITEEEQALLDDELELREEKNS